MEDLRQAVEIAKRILTKERLDRQLMGQSSATPFMSIREGHQRRLLFDIKEELGDKIDKLVVMIGKLATRDSRYEQKFRRGNFRGNVRNYSSSDKSRNRSRERSFSRNNGNNRTRSTSQSRSRSGSRASINRDRSHCYKCREYDHFARDCPTSREKKEIEQLQQMLSWEMDN